PTSPTKPPVVLAASPTSPARDLRNPQTPPSLRLLGVGTDPSRVPLPVASGHGSLPAIRQIARRSPEPMRSPTPGVVALRPARITATTTIMPRYSTEVWPRSARRRLLIV